ncbi:MAG: PHP domain-containing protein [Candidatus Saccharimonadales bacterium]
MMYKVDLHTHSIASKDGGLTPSQYRQFIEDDKLDYIAITDHNTIELAAELKSMLGEAIIVGEEIDSKDGEIIGLYLKKAVTPGMSATKTARAIKQQGGLIYIPHPFETVRHGISKATLEKIMDQIDIIEIYNGRAVFQNKGPEATTFARLNNIPCAASSDAHGEKGMASVYSQISHKPTKNNLPTLLRTAHYSMVRPPLKTLLYPKINRIRKKLGS